MFTHDLRTDVFVQIDMDGTLTDSERLKRHTYRQTMDHLFGVDCGAEEFAELLGISPAETIAALTRRFGHLPLRSETAESKQTDRAVGARILDYRLTLDKSVQLVPRPGADALLDRLDALRVPRGVVTSAKEEKAHVALATVNFTARVHDIVGIGSTAPDGTVARHEKPSRDLFDVSLARFRAQFQIDADQRVKRIVVDDALPGILGAKNSEAEARIYIHDPEVRPFCEETARHATFSTSKMEEAADHIEELVLQWTEDK